MRLNYLANLKAVSLSSPPETRNDYLGMAIFVGVTITFMVSLAISTISVLLGEILLGLGVLLTAITTVYVYVYYPKGPYLKDQINKAKCGDSSEEYLKEIGKFILSDPLTTEKATEAKLSYWKSLLLEIETAIVSKEEARVNYILEIELALWEKAKNKEQGFMEIFSKEVQPRQMSKAQKDGLDYLKDLFSEGRINKDFFKRSLTELNNLSEPQIPAWQEGLWKEIAS